MATKLNIVITLPVPGTKDLKVPDLEAKLDVELDADQDFERAKIAYFQKNYKDKMTKVFQEQLKHFKTPLDSMQAEIDKMHAHYDKLIASDSMTAVAENVKLYKADYDKVLAKKKELEDYLKGAGVNVVMQQFLIYNEKFEKEAEAEAAKTIKKQIQWKKARVASGVVIKGALMIGAATLGIMAAAAAFPVTAAAGAIAYVAFFGPTANGVIALGKFGKSIKDNWNLEEASLNKLQADLESISVHLGQTKGKVGGLQKHLDDASKYYSVRREDLKKSREQVADFDDKIKKYEELIKQLEKGENAPKVLKEKQQALAKAKEGKAKAASAIAAAEALNQKMDELLTKAKTLVGDLNKIPFSSCEGTIEALKGRGGKAIVDGAVEAAGSFGLNITKVV